MATAVKLLNVQQAADQLGLSEIRVRQFCQQGRLGSKVGGTWVISQDELNDFKNQPRPKGRPKEKFQKN